MNYYLTLDIIKLTDSSHVVQNLQIEYYKLVRNRFRVIRSNVHCTSLVYTSSLLESSVRMTCAPTFAAIKPGSDVPAPSCR